MRNHLKHGTLIAAVGVLSFVAACANEPGGGPTPSDAPAATESAPGVSASPTDLQPSAGEDPSDESEPGVTQAELPAYQKVAACVRQHGVNVPDPQVGKPFDTSAMDDIAMTPQWYKILEECPDWEKVVLGVG